MSESDNNQGHVSRREFIGKSVAAATAAGFMIVKPQQVRGTEANSAIRLGLLGCGGRGTADTEFLLNAGPTRLVALADLFQDQLDKARDHFDGIAKTKGQTVAHLPAAEQAKWRARVEAVVADWTKRTPNGAAVLAAYHEEGNRVLFAGH